MNTVGKIMPDSRERITSTRTPLLAFLRRPESEDELGRLGPYIVRSVLGAGGMGVVFRADDSLLARTVALKVLQPEAANDPESLQRFVQEARAVAAVSSDYIVSVYNVGEENGTPYFAMPVLLGESLQSYLDRISERDISFIMLVAQHVLLGLADAHAAGLIHRDIKPGNIWLESDKPGGPFKRAKILDFGLARSVKDNTNLTATGIVMGTPNYMAPEQAGKRPLDGRADLFAFGCVLYRMLTGEMAFTGSSALDVLMAIVTEEPVPVSYRDPSIPWYITDLVTRLLDKDPFFRPSSAMEVAAEIAEFREKLPAVVVPLVGDAHANPIGISQSMALAAHTITLNEVLESSSHETDRNESHAPPLSEPLNAKQMLHSLIGMSREEREPPPAMQNEPIVPSQSFTQQSRLIRSQNWVILGLALLLVFMSGWMLVKSMR